MPKKYFILIIWFTNLTLISCNTNSNKKKNPLEFAGDNKLELTKVLNYYKNSTEDSLKYKAAKFLVENMPYHFYKTPISKFSVVFDSIKNFPISPIRRAIFHKLLDSISKIPSSEKSKLIYDAKTLNSEFIINNIELAFKAWYKIPKNKRASFDDFCNYILPYRSTNEPLELNARKKLFKKYSWIYKHLNNGSSIKSIIDSITTEFCFIPSPKIHKFYPLPLNSSQIEKSKLGICNDGVNYFVNVFRSIGLISARDYVPHWGNHHNSGHSWIYVKYGDEVYYTNTRPGKTNLKDLYKEESIPKVYRATYSFQENLTHSNLNIDVTNEYLQTTDIDIDNIFNVSVDKPSLFVFDVSRNWVPVSYGTVNENKKISYKNIGLNVLYLSATKKWGNIEPINYPFFIDKKNKIHFFNPSKSLEDSIVLTRKYGLTSPRNKRKANWLLALNEGFFEGSNNPDFLDSKILYKIKNLKSTHVNRINLNTTEKFKYVRFNSNKKTSFLAKLAFYNERNRPLTGNVVKENTINLKWENGAYDDNPFSISGGDNFKLGLEFDTPQLINAIEFQARNDDNHINIGEDYELFYWDKTWKTLGKQTAKDTALYYKVPKNSLLWLRNRTIGIEEHVFTIGENNKQKWLGFDNY